MHLQGLEPWAHWLRVSCSTNWARGAYGDPYRNRTDVKGVRGLCLNRLTNGPYVHFASGVRSRLDYFSIAVVLCQQEISSFSEICAAGLPPRFFRSGIPSCIQNRQNIIKVVFWVSFLYFVRRGSPSFLWNHFKQLRFWMKFVTFIRTFCPLWLILECFYV